jgi:ectoine hydroxylase-related dioxygenase (phytanoyl-CoA dioxygenase family)
MVGIAAAGLSTLEQDGYLLMRRVVPAEVLRQLVAEIESLLEGRPEEDRHTFAKSRGETSYAVRHFFMDCPRAKEIAAKTVVVELAQAALGTNARLVRSLLFSKPPGANWRVPWHQDLTIAVSKKMELPQWGPWSVKSGIVHVQPPLDVMRQCLSLRIHLDDCTLKDGPLRVLPGSHQRGADNSSHVGEVICEASAGDVLIMRPLLMHRSLPAAGGGPRRVLHLEFSAANLPVGLAWAEPGF